MKINRTVKTFGALANTRRLAIVLMAAKNPNLTRHDILTAFDMSQQNMDRNIHILLKAAVMSYGPKYGRVRTLKINQSYLMIIKKIMKMRSDSI